jgi:hypothetical protein
LALNAQRQVGIHKLIQYGRAMIRVSQLFVLFLLALLSLTGSTAEWKDLWRPNSKQGDKRCVHTYVVQVGQQPQIMHSIPTQL